MTEQATLPIGGTPEVRRGNFKEVSASGVRYMDMVMVHGHGTLTSVSELDHKA